ncbi:nodulation protein NolU, partial [Mesorhizobium sp. M2D.F.Ca.ET.223.01.1.1]
MSLPMPIQTARPDGPHQLRFPGASELAASAHPTRLAARLDPALSAETLVKLQKCSRLHPRLAELL